MNKLNAVALKFGILSFLYYTVATFVCYSVFGMHNASFSTAYIVCYVLFLVLLFLCGWYYQNNVNLEADFKNLFRIMFIVIIFGELGLSVAQYIYVQYVNVAFFDQLHDNTKAWMEQNSNWTQDQKEAQLKAILDQKGVKFQKLFMVFAQSLVKDSILALIFIFIIKKRTLKK